MCKKTREFLGNTNGDADESTQKPLWVQQESERDDTNQVIQVLTFLNFWTNYKLGLQMHTVEYKQNKPLFEKN